MARFVVEDSGYRQQFGSGAVRDTEDGKPRYDLISPHALRRIAEHMRRGADKYAARNWEKGIPRERLVSSALRHLYKYIEAHDLGVNMTEDHLAAVCFNVMALLHFEEKGWPADATPVDYKNCPATTCQDDCDTCDRKHAIKPLAVPL